MKKALSLFVTLATLLALLTSCSTVSYKDVKRISLEDVSCESFFLYSFYDAEVSGYQDYYSDEYPSEYGYVYSSELLSPGDEIEVWGQFSFNYYDEYYGHGTKYGTTARVGEVVEVYKIQLLRSGSSYNITFFAPTGAAVGSGTAVSSIDSLAEVEKYKVELITENPVFIEFYA